jgi:outer membrane protein TolC
MQATLFDIDQTYWTVVSLRSKYQLAVSFRNLVSKLNSDVHKMIDEGVATRADGLKVDVRVNEADMQVTQLENGLSLAKMLLCQLCGLSLEEDITLADEVNETQTTGSEQAALSVSEAGSMLNDTQENRPELRMLQNAVDLSREATRLVRAEYLPQVLLTGGYMVSNPNVFNGFQRRFAGVWNVGVMVRVPVWNWFEGEYKIRASKAATNIACMELNDVQEKIDLQIAQSRYKLSEAQKRLSVTQKNIASANENLRCANIGFREGVMETTDVMAAQTAWQQAQSQHIDAQIDLRMSQIGLRRALGVLY